MQREIRQRITYVFELISDFLLLDVDFRELLFRRIEILIHAVLPGTDFEVVETFLLIFALSVPGHFHWTRLGSGPEKKPENKHNDAGTNCPGKPRFRFQLFQKRHV